MIIVALMVIRFVASAQQAKPVLVSGSVTDAAGKKLGFVSVSLINLSDTSSKTNTATNDAGIFRIEATPGTYAVHVRGIGFIPYSSRAFVIAQDPITLGAFVLTRENKQLQEVKVTTTQPPIQAKNGKLVLNVGQSAVATGATALDILQRAPGVSVDQNENVLLKGSPQANVMIDGKPTQLSGQQLASLLRGMNAANISKIEIINAPSAQYDAAGSSGMINIVTKRNNKQGYAADISTTFGTGRKFLHRENITGNIRTGNWNIYGNAGFDRRHFLSERSSGQIRRGTGSPVLLDRFTLDEMRTNYYSYRAGFDWTINKRSEFGLVYTGYTDDWSRDARATTRVLENRTVLNSVIDNQNILKEPYINDGFNLSYKLALDTMGKSFTANADHISYRNNSDGYLANQVRSPSGDPLEAYQRLNFHQPSYINISSLRADLEVPLKKMSVRTGLKYADVKIDNNFRYDSLVNNVYVYAPSLSDHFVYKERIAAAYVSVEKKGEKNSLEVGLRSEYTYSDPNSISAQIRNTRKYLSLFPSASYELKLSKIQKLSVAASRRINRPVYGNLNPVRYFSDKYAYFEGNPNLKPEFAWLGSVTYSLRDTYIATLSYTRAENFISQSAMIDPSGVLITSNSNFAHQDRYDLLVVAPLRICGFWSMSNTLNVSYTDYPLQQIGGIKQVNRFAIDVVSNHSFRLPGNIQGELNTRYTSPTLNGVYVYRYFLSFDAGAKRSFADNKLEMRLSFTDFLRTIRYQGYTITNTADNWYKTKPDSRRFNVSVIYHIGGKLNRGKTQRIDEQDRL